VEALEAAQEAGEDMVDLLGGQRVTVEQLAVPIQQDIDMGLSLVRTHRCKNE
jgi:hypothetical protein